MGIIRFLLATSVIAAHVGGVFGLSYVGGKIAVETFFIISGFYMALILDKKYKGNDAYGLFITNRLLRIYPLYLIVLFFSVIFFMFLSQDIGQFPLYKTYFAHFTPFVKIYLILSQIGIFGLDVVMFLGVHVVDGSAYFTTNYLDTNPLLYNFLFIPQAWTLSLELLFYLIIPFIHKKTRLILGIIFFSICLRFILYRSGLHAEPWTNRFFPTELAFFLMGTLVYTVRKKFFYTFCKKPYDYIFFMLFLLFFCFYEKMPYISWGIDIKQSMYFMLLLGLLPYIFSLSKQWKFDMFLGELSYPMYLSHLLVFSVVQKFHFGNPQWQGIEAYGITIMFSICLYYIFDKPIDRYRQYRVKHTHAVKH